MWSDPGKHATVGEFGNKYFMAVGSKGMAFTETIGRDFRPGVEQRGCVRCRLARICHGHSLLNRGMDQKNFGDQYDQAFNWSGPYISVILNRVPHSVIVNSIQDPSEIRVCYAFDQDSGLTGGFDRIRWRRRESLTMASLRDRAAVDGG